ncbi:hypothetical protein CF66_2372 [Candidatus Photodesmus katoptron]|uniref:Metallo-beta-lactamase n=1 Tax=Candidatus Photodesmus katoptron Akat1 TaxID=1236703 RepID=S3DKF3_9GAMM|nr:MBL fold metallo-hydrolase [Candidatus Photodesmus katoptron]EPE37614.1 metallo-beta-lactamase [Candidatus Photodesmus katoptron Akat1]KEY90667.1 hypothetical protein CF66_2372 [Candidatus Photodesmus katoptron]
MSIKYQVVPVTSFFQNCSIVWCDETMEGIVIDPGGDEEKLANLINKLKIKVICLVLTHGHLDHVGGTQALSRILGGINIIGPHKKDKFWFKALDKQSKMFSLPIIESFEPKEWLKDQDQIKFGKQILDVFHTPGHTPGHIVLFNQKSQLAFVGDVLFNGSIGRTDFPGSSLNELINSIKTKLWPLGDTVHFISGHGPESTFGYERTSNPVLLNLK